MRQLKSHIQKVLKRMGVYQRFKGSLLYDAYWWIVDRRILRQRSREVEFYRELLHGLRKGDLIYDIGANQGQKSDVFLRLGANVLAVDPDEANQIILRQKFLDYRISPKPITIVGMAVSNQVGVETLWMDAPGSAKNTLNSKWVQTLRTDEKRFGARLDFCQEMRVETTTLEELFKTYGFPYFVKIDVEGHEPEVLRGMRRPVPFLSFEVNLPEFRTEGLVCLDLLESTEGGGSFNYAASCEGGLMLKRWVRHGDFCQALKSCMEPSIEVFWRTNNSHRVSNNR